MIAVIIVGRCALALLSILATSGVAAQSGAAATAVWIDTDPAAGILERDVDDGLALIQAFRSPELAIRGVSIVFGNASFGESRAGGTRDRAAADRLLDEWGI